MREGQSGNKPMTNNIESKNIESNETESREPADLTFDDLMFIADSHLGLRHVSTRKKANDEMENGVMGDSLAIYNSLNLISKENLEQTISDPAFDQVRKNKFILRSFIDHNVGYIDQEAREQILEDFNENVYGFVLDSIGMDLNRQEFGIPLDELIRNIIDDSPSFLIVLGDTFAYDADNYYGLGKSGKKEIKKFFDVFSLTVEDFNSLEKPAETMVTKETWSLVQRFIANVIYDKFVATIKKLRTNNKK